MASPSQAAPPEKQKLYEALVDAINVIFGVHPGYRTVHAKGVVCEGVFTPSSAAAPLSRAPHFTAEPVPVLARFSDNTGIPDIPDTDPGTSPRGLALKFQLPGGAASDIVSHSTNGFPVGTAEEFLEFLQSIAASGPDVAHPSPVEKFLGTHPAALAFVQPRPAPKSFATLSFFSVNAVRFINADGVARYGRYQIRPVAGEAFLTPEETSAMPPNFLFDELSHRLAQGPIEFKLVVQLAKDGDKLNDASVTWPDDRKTLEVGTIRIHKVAADSDAVQRKLIFDPVRLADGIELSDDPLPAARSAVYSISYARRNPS